MIAKYLVGPHYTGHPQVLNPTWEQIEKAIRNMDGSSLSLVLIEIDEDHPYMSIGGGGDRFVVYITSASMDDISNLQLINDYPRGRETFIPVVSGGQEANYPTYQVVGLDTVLLVAKTFSETGEPDASCIWEER